MLSHQDDTALLKAYIVEWRKFFTQCDILPKPFCQLEITLMGKQGSNKKSNVEDSIVRKVRRGGRGAAAVFGCISIDIREFLVDMRKLYCL